MLVIDRRCFCVHEQVGSESIRLWPHGGATPRLRSARLTVRRGRNCGSGTTNTCPRLCLFVNEDRPFAPCSSSPALRRVCVSSIAARTSRRLQGVVVLFDHRRNSCSAFSWARVRPACGNGSYRDFPKMKNRAGMFSFRFCHAASLKSSRRTIGVRDRAVPYKTYSGTKRAGATAPRRPRDV